MTTEEAAGAIVSIYLKDWEGTSVKAVVTILEKLRVLRETNPSVDWNAAWAVAGKPEAWKIQ